MMYRILVLLVASFIAESAAQLVCANKDKSTVHYFYVEENAPINTKIGNLQLRGNSSQLLLTPDYSRVLFLNVSSQDVFVIGKIDFENTTTIEWNIDCSPIDGTHSTKMNLKIIVNVYDTNDNRPVFHNGSYSVFVNEMLPSGSVIKDDIVAKDADDRGKQIVTYSIVPGPYSTYFDIPRKTKGVLKLIKPLDYESVQRIDLVIKAEDTSADSLSSFANFTVHVQDGDDQNPTFSHPMYSTSILSSYPPGSLLTFDNDIHAFDQDLSINSSLSYSVWDPFDSFQVNQESGVVTLKNYITNSTAVGILKAIQRDNVDRVGTAVLRVDVYSAPTTSPPEVSTSSSTIVTSSQTITTQSTTLPTTRLSTTNMTRWPSISFTTRPPVFPPRIINLTVREDYPVGHIIYVIGIDIPETLTFNSLTNTNKRFIVHKSGAVLLRKALDYEASTKHELGVIATDIFGRQFTSVVKIDVMNVNEFSPVVTNPHRIVSSSRKPGIKITTIEATDEDADTVLNFTFSAPNEYFFIGETGEIYTTPNLNDLKADVYQLSVIVRDDGDRPLIAVAAVTVTLPYQPRVEYVAMMTSTAQYVIVGLSIAGGVLLVAIILLVVYIVRRRLYSDEHLGHVGTYVGIGTSLRYKDNRPQNNYINSFMFSREDASSDGATTIGENVVQGEGINGALTESKENVQDLEIETGITPFRRDDTIEKRHPNGGLKTFKDDNADGHLSDESIEKNRPELITVAYNNTLTPWPRQNGYHKYTSLESLETAIVPADDKPEITVYF